MSIKQLLKCQEEGRYIFDLENGIIISTKTNKEVYLFNHNTDPQVEVYGHWFLRLYYENHYLCTSRARILWMIGNEISLPRTFHIHHIDEDPDNDAFDNLVALYKKDHEKIHRLRNTLTEEVAPF